MAVWTVNFSQFVCCGLLRMSIKYHHIINIQFAQIPLVTYQLNFNMKIKSTEQIDRNRIKQMTTLRKSKSKNDEEKKNRQHSIGPSQSFDTQTITFAPKEIPMNLVSNATPMLSSKVTIRFISSHFIFNVYYTAQPRIDNKTSTLLHYFMVFQVPVFIFPFDDIRATN